MSDVQKLDSIALDFRQEMALENWRSLQTTDAAPQRSQFKPERVARALPAAMLLQVERSEAGIRFRQKLEGRYVAQVFGEALGQCIDDVYDDEHLFKIMPRLLETAITGEPAMVTGSAQTKSASAFPFTRLVLPFAGEDGHVARLLVVYAFNPTLLAQLSAPLRVRRNDIISRHDRFSVRREMAKMRESNEARYTARALQAG